jgi:hypothetical protein
MYYGNGQRLAKLNPDGIINYYLKDHLGNVRVTLDEEGRVVGYNDYATGTTMWLSLWFIGA